MGRPWRADHLTIHGPAGEVARERLGAMEWTTPKQLERKDDGWDYREPRDLGAWRDWLALTFEFPDPPGKPAGDFLAAFARYDEPLRETSSDVPRATP